MAFSDNDYIDFRSNYGKWYPALVMFEVKSTRNASILYKKHNKVIVEDVKLENNANVKPPHSHTMQIVAHCKNTTQHIAIQPIYFYDSSQQKDFILIATDDPRQALQAYDIQSDTFVSIGHYPLGFTPINHGNAIINNSNDSCLKYFIFGGRYGVFGTVNLKLLGPECTKTLQVETKKYHDPMIRIQNPMSTLINGNLHIFSDKGVHLKYNMNSSKLKRLKNFGINHGFNSSIKMVHIGKLQKVMFFGDDYSENIWYFDYSLDANECDFHWKMYKSSMPNKLNQFCAIQAYDTMVILFYYGDVGAEGEHDVYCLDLIDDKWYKSEKKYNYSARIRYNIFDKLFVVATRDNVLHFICDKYHFTSKLIDVIPDELRKVYAKRHSFCVSGYLKKVTMDISVPQCLCDLISVFSSSLF